MLSVLESAIEGAFLRALLIFSGSRTQEESYGKYSAQFHTRGLLARVGGRGYWQELIETNVWAHQLSPIANMMGWRDKPVALSIVQARVVGLAHFSVGYVLTYAAFLIASTSGKFG